MKIIHTSDWHLGNTFHGHSREAEHAHFLGWLTEMLAQQQPDALIIAGDIFDTANPSAAAENMFYEFLARAGEVVKGLQIVVIAGNHDSGGRLEAPAELLRKHNVYVRGVLKTTANDEPDYEHHILPLSSRTSSEAEVVVFALPFLRPTDYPARLSQEEGLRNVFQGMHKCLKKSDFRGLPVIVGAHFYASGADICAEEHSERLVVGGQDRADISVAGKDVSYVALGHIHKAQQISQNAWYAGSVLPMSFSEKAYSHGVLLVNIGEAGEEVAVERLAYTPLRRLISIPSKGAALASEVMREIERIPERGKGDEGLSWPYLEIRVMETQPEPSLLSEVTAALSTRGVYFCRMLRETSKKNAAKDEKESLASLQTLSPLDMAKKIFVGRYGEEMPKELIEKFNIAVGLAEEKEE